MGPPHVFRGHRDPLPDLRFELHACSSSAPPLLLGRPRRRVGARWASVTAAAAGSAPPPRAWWRRRAAPPPLKELPVGLGSGPADRRRYVWDGARVRPVSPASAASGGEAAADAAAARAHAARAAAWRAFFPTPHAVTPDYWAYCRWRAAHRLCSSMLTNFATQALLQAVGVGGRRALPAAAGINWLLKDGLGRLGRLTVATRFGDSFDSDLKRFRFATSLLFTASVGLELATPRFPRHFLALAAVANVGKSVGLTTYISTQPSFGASFAAAGNLADITAKAQAQQMVVDTVGLALCVATLRRGAARAAAAATAATATATAAAPVGVRVPLALLAALAVGDLTAIAGEMRSVHLRTLNRARAEIAADAWLAAPAPAGRRRGVPSPADAARVEPLLLGVAPARRSGVSLRLAPLEEAVASPAQLARALARARGSGGAAAADLLPRGGRGRDRFLLTVLPPPWAGAPAPVAALLGALLPGVAAGRLRVALRADARPADVTAAVLAAAAARRELEALPRAARGGGDDAEAALDRGAAAARRWARAFGGALAEGGWVTDPFLLAPREKAAWVPLG